jgi:hypothetical protein
MKIGVPHNPSRSAARKGQLTSSACLECRKRKIKVSIFCSKIRVVLVTNGAYFWRKQCHGGRPACVRCLWKGRACKYDVEEGVTWQQDLYMRLRSVQEELAQMNELVHRLRHGSETYAVELLARLRMGEDVARLIASGPQWLSRCVCFVRAIQLGI